MGLHLRKERLENITATEMSSVLGLNPYKTASAVRKGKLDPQKIESIHLRRGVLLEPAVLEALKEDLGWETLRHEDSTIVMKDHRIAATPDAYLTHKKGLVECKSIGYKSFEKWYYQAPPAYLVQAHVQMMVTGLPVCYLAALEAGDPYVCEWRLVVWEVVADKDMEALMQEEVRKFWDLFKENKALRASEPVKTKALGLLNRSSKIIYPKDIPIPEEVEAEAMFSKILSVFE
jgi:putative phage-type endonuclease